MNDPLQLWHLAMLVITQVAAAGAIYGGIRADLANMKERINENGASVTRAHSRIDGVIEHRADDRNRH